jgi:hypothetical protein
MEVDRVGDSWKPAQHVSLVFQGVAVEDFELRVLHPVQQDVHAGQIVGGDVLFLGVTVDSLAATTIVLPFITSRRVKTKRLGLEINQ